MSLIQDVLREGLGRGVPQEDSHLNSLLDRKAALLHVKYTQFFIFTPDILHEVPLLMVSDSFRNFAKKS
jgi:hypothetical protein